MPRTRSSSPKAKPKPSADDPRTKAGACVKVPSGDRAYVEGIDSKDSGRVVIKYEAGLGLDSYPLHMLTLVQESPEVEPEPANTSGLASLKTSLVASPLDQLASQINALHSDCEAARQVAKNAEESALQHAIKVGELLLQAKEQAGHSNWEQWRSENLNLPSSTATLYQRCFEQKEKLEGATTLREAQKLLKKARGQTKELPAALSATPQTKSATVADLPKRFQPGDRVQIQADDDLNGTEAIVAGTETDEFGNIWVDIRCEELSGMALDYRADDLKPVQPASPNSLFELGQLLERADNPEPVVSFISDLQAEVAAMETTATVETPAPTTPQSSITPDQRVAEQLILQFNTSILEVAKRLVKWCNDEELDLLSNWIADETWRREGYANAEEGTRATLAPLMKKSSRRKKEVS